MTPGGADQANEPRRGDIIARVLEKLPLGLAIHDRAAGTSLFANAAAHAFAKSQEGDGEHRDVEAVRHVVEVAGRSYDVLCLTDMTERRRVEDELAKRAFFDDLTGLPKTNLMQQTVNAMIAEGAPPFALSFIDVDNFKFINDYYGHGVGDQLLVKIAKRISENSRNTDLLARVGGDEFVLLTAPLSTPDEVGPEVERLSARFREPFFIDGFEIFASASIGVSLYPAHGQSYEILRAAADSAMYRVKESAKGGIRLFDANLSEAATARMEVEQRLRLAIRDRSFLCAFQPKVDFRTDEIVGLEVLLRWRDENGTIRAPGDFIKLAIELGLMDEISMILLDQVVEQIDEINDAFGANASISLNVAARQATDLAFMQTLVARLVQTGYPSRFVVELTEEAFLSKGEFQSHILPMLREHGIGVSIDDFGVGYSSLSMLAEITADELKVDRSFITGIHAKPRNQTILKVIELLGSALGLRIVVEGVETYEELAYLQAATRITVAQGYYFAKPMFLTEPSRPSTEAPSRGGRSQRGNARGSHGRY
ncbi:Cyclic di-GMP phosphodiesterase Gmr [Beijerinckiaceae bacterium RH AL1]|nr:EAL domain-containing protein [Beijerinckiaceae bacterium]VVB48887.1 Cyclic di-GMP phosphodiesterase Gmr [Beijerinckiaceae bacterium RH CH11]VVB48965.1 Cyclic di-GMP phosphodiesterase Gmr [Beijerinckiaceae bacterium RH AL8]VVC56619.1 Cyclic di-GMP phosphodiesterase Gmr [Beijerinckiaceae bacterium RH AL1]